MTVYFTVASLFQALKYFYFLEESKQIGTYKKIHLFSKEYGIHFINLSSMFLVGELIIADSHDTSKFNPV